MITTSLIVAYAALIPLLIGSAEFGRITWKQCAGWMAVLCASAGLLAVVNGWTSSVYLYAGLSAWMVWLWWTGGGGDDTKRRLKRWAGRFQGVRRTAPQGA